MMKRKILLLVLAMLLLTGCGGAEEYRVSTVVYIPVSPTEEPTSEPEETLAAQLETQVQTEVPTEPEPTEAVSEPTEPAKKPSSSKGSKKKSNKKETEPPATEPPSTESPATESPVTEPPATEPATEPSATEPSATEPSATELPATEPEPTKPALYDISGYSVGSLEKAMRKAINAYRTEAELGELKLSNKLCAIASCRAYEVSQVWSHTRPDGRGYGSVLSDYGYGAGTVKELLVYVSGSGDAGDIVDKWMASDSHRQLLLGEFTTIGIGVYRSGGYTYVACLLIR